MTYGEQARYKFGDEYCYWIKGWKDYENFRHKFTEKRMSDFALAAYNEGYETRNRVDHQTMSMLVEQ